MRLPLARATNGAADHTQKASAKAGSATNTKVPATSLGWKPLSAPGSPGTILGRFRVMSDNPCILSSQFVPNRPTTASPAPAATNPQTPRLVRSVIIHPVYKGVIEAHAEQHTRYLWQAVFDADGCEQADRHHRHEKSNRPIERGARYETPASYIPHNPEPGHCHRQPCPSPVGKEQERREDRQPYKLPARNPFGITSNE